MSERGSNKPHMNDPVLEALRRYDSCTLSNAIERFDVRPRDTGYLAHDIGCIFPDLPVMVGYAATMTIRARGNVARRDDEPVWRHVLSVPSPRVVVVQDLDDPPGCGAFWGEVMSTIFSALGCEGTVTNGCVRDLQEVREIGFRYFAASVGVSHAYVRWEDVATPVQVGGATVHPGDIIHGDRHGVLLVPSEIVHDLPAAADIVIESEQELIRWVRSSEFTLERLADRRGRAPLAYVGRDPTRANRPPPAEG
jgi:4-hydroxy-4-methyl-2-oxoglutarate aldolase